MNRKTWILLCAVLVSPASHAASLLVAVTPFGLPSGESEYGYGRFAWQITTSLIDARHNVTTTNSFSDLGQMLAYDAIWLDQRGSAALLSDTEIANITAYIATGHKVVLFGENDNWVGWDNQILAITGGTYTGEATSETLQTAVSNDLTAGVQNVLFIAAGTASGGTPLFNQGAVTLWGDNVLTVLDINFLDDGPSTGLVNADNFRFTQNIIDWIGPQTVPVPPAIWLLGSALLGLVGLKRRRLTAALRS